jgi:murein DD-endopeptidase MepM/ murein hydrolase activator NlpD
MALTDSIFPLVRASNNIVRINRSTGTMKNTQTSFSQFLSFMSSETQSLKSIKFDEKKIRKIQSINPVDTFGRPGNLLSGLASGALDAASVVGNFFGRGKPANTKAGQPIPKGPKVKFGGMRALGIANAVFAGLDFATGLSEGESVGKSAAGAGGSLAGSLIGGAIGQALIPVPGLGFVLGSMAGGFLGGYAGDRAYETAEKITGKEQLKQQEAKQKAAALAISQSQNTWPATLDKFEKIIGNFERASVGGFLGPSDLETDSTEYDEEEMSEGPLPDSPNTNPNSGDLGNYEVSGGNLPSTKRGSRFGPRGGRNHNGIDYLVASGTPISVVQPGVISAAGNIDPNGWGNTVEIQHPDGSTTRYAHLSAITVKQGQKIEPGTLIGYSGGRPGAPGSGNSRGEHLHYEYLPAGGRAADPAQGNNDDKYFRFGGNVKVKPKVTPQNGMMGQSGGKVAVVATGTNTSGDPAKVKEDTLKIINELKRKGYTPIIVPPNESAYSAAHKASVEAAKMGGAQVEKGTYSSSDPLHLTMDSAKAIREKYKGAEFVGDSNAVRIAGGGEVQGRRVVGSQTSAAIQYARSLPDIVAAQPTIQAPRQQTITQQQMQQIQQYPSYNTQRTTTMIVPITQSNGNQIPRVISSPSSGQQTVIMPGPSEGQVLNSLFKKILLTNLSST